MTESDKDESRKELLLEIFSKIPVIKGRTKLQKIIFLGQEELGLPKLFEYDEYHYGPYSQELTDVLDEMVFDGTVVEECRMRGDFITYTYKLSETAASAEESTIQTQTIQKLKKLSRVPRSKIVDYVYRKYLPHRVPS